MGVAVLPSFGIEDRHGNPNESVEDMMTSFACAGERRLPSARIDEKSRTYVRSAIVLVDHPDFRRAVFTMYALFDASSDSNLRAFSLGRLHEHLIQPHTLDVPTVFIRREEM